MSGDNKEKSPIKTVSRVYSEVFKNVPASFPDYDSYKPRLDDIGKYSLVKRLGQGKYSVVFEAKTENNEETVVIKILKPVRANKVKREMKILEYLRGGINILPLLGIIMNQNINALIFENMSNAKDLKNILPDLTESDGKHYMYQLMRTLDFCHSRGIIHRDVKPQNIIVDQQAKKIRLIDWGLAEYYIPGRELNVRVASRYYKSPELLVDYKYYDYSLDMWSSGCVFALILFRIDPFFQGASNVDQLFKIVKVLGFDCFHKYISKYNIQPNIEERYLNKFVTQKRKHWQRFVTTENEHLITQNAISLLESMLKFDHMERITAPEALKHPYFHRM